jgi:hypothetical protein
MSALQGKREIWRLMRYLYTFYPENTMCCPASKVRYSDKCQKSGTGDEEAFLV